MKKIIQSSLVLFISVCTVLLIPLSKSFAQEVLSVQSESTPIYVEYELAFPGMLPDHPLYKAKIMRDRIMAFVTSNPQKLADFYLLQTDKGILAAAMLVDKNNSKLAATTALKAEHNFTLLTQQLFRFPKKPETAFYQKLKTAAAKHQEVLASLEKRTTGEEAKTFETIIEFSKKNVQTITDFQTKKTFEESLLE
ncbi:hypothetical protein HY948_04720 [Candidatus Gottesmanbacteria bacterium]|nr:hypothetical protein [Candidatus Gottesmanbacteria bacterium]